MKTQNYSFELNNRIIDILPEEDFFFDIETTGLSKSKTILYMIGCGYRKGSQLHIIQWFNDDAISEPEILRTFASFIEQFNGRVYTFNGESFDIPYLKLHYEYNEITCPLDRFTSIDLYRILKPFQHLFSMEHGKQKDWEAFLGLYREDQYDGGQLIKVYKDYLKKKDPNLLELLFLHNMEDVKGMSHVLELLSFQALIDGCFHITDVQALSVEEYATYADETRKVDSDYSICSKARPTAKQKIPVEEPGSYLQLHCKLAMEIPASFCIHAPYGSVSVSGQELILTLPCYEGELKHFLPNYKDYYYLPTEDTAVHVSVGCFVQSKFRKKAKASTCYVKKTGCFLAFPKTQKHYGFHIDTSDYKDAFSLYKRNYQRMVCYVDFESLDLFALDPDIMPEQKNDTTLYLSDVIKEIFISYLDGEILTEA